MLRFAAFLIICVASAAHAVEADDSWVEGFGQGIAEATITKGPGNQIVATCEAGSGFPSTGILFTLGGRAPTGDRVTLTFDGDDPRDYAIEDGAITSDSRAAASYYVDAIERMKRHRSVHVRFENGDGTRFTLNGAAKAIGDCEPDFFR